MSITENSNVQLFLLSFFCLVFFCCIVVVVVVVVSGFYPFHNTCQIVKLVSHHENMPI